MRSLRGPLEMCLRDCSLSHLQGSQSSLTHNLRLSHCKKAPSYSVFKLVQLILQKKDKSIVYKFHLSPQCNRIHVFILPSRACVSRFVFVFCIFQFFFFKDYLFAWSSSKRNIHFRFRCPLRDQKKFIFFFAAFSSFVSVAALFNYIFLSQKKKKRIGLFKPSFSS